MVDVGEVAAIGSGLGEATDDETFGDGDVPLPTVGVVPHADAMTAVRASARIHTAVFMSLQQ